MVRVLVVAAVSGVTLGTSSPVSAADIEVDAPSESTVGEVVQVSATVTDGGQPVTDAVVAVTRQARLGGVSGFVLLDSGVTDDAGMVAFEFVQYADSSDVAAMRVEYEGPDGVEAAEFELTVLPGPQQFSSSSGADIGPLNLGWLIFAIAVVWIFALVAAWQMVTISRAREGAKLRHHAMPYYMVGFVAFTAIGMFYVVVTQPTMHANLAPNEPFGRVPTAFVGAEDDYLGLASHHMSRPDDLSGEVLYVQTGCVSCHGIGGHGAIVGSELSVATMSDDDEVLDAIRRGPKGMPVYSELALSDAEVDRIIDYVIAVSAG
jgi:mono/diheme cytochrome c family protein